MHKPLCSGLAQICSAKSTGGPVGWLQPGTAAPFVFGRVAFQQRLSGGSPQPMQSVTGYVVGILSQLDTVPAPIGGVAGTYISTL